MDILDPKSICPHQLGFGGLGKINDLGVVSVMRGVYSQQVDRAGVPHSDVPESKDRSLSLIKTDID
jgi:hypothetical protein